MIEDLYHGKINPSEQCAITAPTELSEEWKRLSENEVLFMARPTMSKVIYAQQLGRGMRTHEGKEFLMVFDKDFRRKRRIVYLQRADIH